MEGDTFPRGTVPTKNVPDILEEPLPRPSSFLDLEIPLVSLGVLTPGTIDPQEVKRARSAVQGIPKIQGGFTGLSPGLVFHRFVVRTVAMGRRVEK